MTKEKIYYLEINRFKNIWGFNTVLPAKVLEKGKLEVENKDGSRSVIEIRKISSFESIKTNFISIVLLLLLLYICIRNTFSVIYDIKAIGVSALFSLVVIAFYVVSRYFLNDKGFWVLFVKSALVISSFIFSFVLAGEISLALTINYVVFFLFAYWIFLHRPLLTIIKKDSEDVKGAYARINSVKVA